MKAPQVSVATHPLE